MRKSPVVSLSISTVMVVTSVVQPALAGELPSGGKVVAGDASITKPSADNLLVTQKSDKSIVNWNSFSIGKGNSVTFNNGSGATLNRVTGGDASKIYGKLSASGSVFLVNQNGVLIGESGVIETGGSFIASTLDVTDEDFLNGGDITFSGSADTSVVNLGQISSLGGDVALISRTVVNEGKLTAQQGTVGLAAGREILLRDAALDDGKFLVKVGGATDSVTEKGMIEAAVAELKTNGGNIYALAGNDGGAINATGFSKSGGRVFLGAGGGRVKVNKTIRSRHNSGGTTDGGEIFINADLVEISGLLDASGDVGGNIDIGANSNITLTNALLDASGATGGGQVRVGGELMGGRDLAVDEVQNVARLLVDEASRIDVSSSEGAGGAAILWSEERTDFAGHIDAFGSDRDVNGGFAEVSSYGSLGFAGTVDTGGGTLLLDPTDIEIGLADSGIANSFISLTTLATALFANDVVVTTHDDGRSDPGHIYWTSDYTYDYSNDLSLLANGNIVFSGSLQNQNATGGAVNLVAGWDGTSGLTGTVTGGLQTNLTFDNSVFASADLSTQTMFGQSYDGGTNFGSVIIGDGTQTTGIAVGSRSGETNVYGYNLVLRGSDTTEQAYAQLGFQVSDATAVYNVNGDISVRLANDANVQAGAEDYSYAQIGHIGADPGAPDAIEATVDATTTAEVAGNINFTGGSSGYYSYAQLGHGGYGAYGAFGGAIDIVSVNDLTFQGGAGYDAPARLGHGGTYAVGDHTGNITITSANDLSFLGGEGHVSFAQLGHGGYRANGTHEGDIVITSANDLKFEAKDYTSYAHLGHGGYNVTGNKSGSITLASVNNVTFAAGIPDSFAYAQLGHGGHFSSDDHSGDIQINSTGSLAFTAGDLSFSYAQLGHGGLQVSGNHSGDVTVSVAGDVTLTGGAGSWTYALIGHGDATYGNSSQASGTRQGDIFVDTSGEFSIIDGDDPTNNYSWAWFGHATSDTDAISNANIFAQATAFDRDSSAIASGGLGIFSTDMIENGLSGGNVALIATDSSLSLEAASGAVSDDQTYSSANSLSLLAAYDMNFADVGLQNESASGGDVNLVAGYNVNQTVWTPSADFDATVFDSQVLGSLALFGQNGGSVVVGDGAQADDILVGTRSGANRAYGYDVNVVGSNGGYVALLGYLLDGTDFADGTFLVRAENDVLVEAGNEGGFAMIGHRAYSALGGLFGDLLIEAVNDVSVLANEIGSFAQIGHGGGGFSYESTSGDVDGDITVLAGGDVTVKGGVSGYAYGRIGHLGTESGGLFGSIGDVSGDITIDADGSLLVVATGPHRYADAQIGHGGADAAACCGIIGSLSGDIAITVGGDADLTGGSGYASYAQVGHGGYNYAQDGGRGGWINGNVSLTSDGTVTLQAGNGDYSYAQVGHGGQEVASDGGSVDVLAGNVTVAGAEGIVLSGGSYKAYAQIGHGGSEAGEDFGAIGEISGDVSVSTDGDVSATGGDDEQAYAQIGHGGAGFVQDSGIAGPVGGNVTLIAGGAVDFQAGSGDYSYTQIGHGGQDAGTGSGSIDSLTGNILVEATSSIGLVGGSYKAYSQIGHGGGDAGENLGSIGTFSGSVELITDGDVVAEGGIDAQAYAQLGHGGANSNNSNSGDITLTAGGNVRLIGGEYDSTYAQLGHGAAEYGASGQTGGTQQGDITLTADGEVSIENGSGDYSFAWLGHATASIGAISNADVTATAAGYDQDASVFLASGANGTISDRILDNALSGGNVWIKATDTGLALYGTVAQANANDLTVIAANDIVFQSGLSFQNTGSGNLIFAAGDDFHNDSGSLTPLGVGTGRWLIYSTRPDNNRDDIEITNRDFLRYATTFDESDPAPASFASGNGLIYSVAPIVKVIAEDQTILYGEDIDPDAFEPLVLTVNGVIVDADEFDIDLGAVTAAVELAQNVPMDSAGHAESGFWSDGLEGAGSFTGNVWYGVGITSENGDLTVVPPSADPDTVSATATSGTCRYDVVNHQSPASDGGEQVTLYEFKPTAQCYNMRQVLPVSKICSVDGTCFDVSTLLPETRNVN
ncbi:MAG: filamentous hemagglutinin N-terminal domain-containing protein [Roseibium sp.]|uniref:two-partner secretion domain-containing protein n=1 Tax=Roseibium sp. TaxID=1936156 RepID=UPI002635F8E9|nr:filamentous hemagglutinin N-terminal domain-containing protein [Roseibium sp.]MCV0424648.1 filamentous hemagglutinin N-terminal domain-containing protein [Roseibium sp.]